MSDEEYELASQYDEHGLLYKGQNFLEWRYGFLGVLIPTIFGGFALVVAGVIIGGLKSWRDSTYDGAISDIFRLKHAKAKR